MKILIILCCFLGYSTGVEVETKYGRVAGQTITLVDDYHAGIAIDSFYAVPFARPPVDELRFEPPEEPEPWTDVFQAVIPGSVCSQVFGGLVWEQKPGWNDYSEDCLHLNIFAPSDQSGAPYPVLVFYYGGSYQEGANIQYLGHFLAVRGVVVVEPNYRLGIFGFAYTGDGVIQGNMGLMDQALALQYIQENIAAYGGDPDMVTISGQSAGASSVGMQIISPLTEGLFHQAIMQSGTDLVVWGLNEPGQQPEDYIKQVAEQVDCPTYDTRVMTDCLKTKTRQELQDTKVTCAEGYACLGIAPVVDGPGGFIPDTPYNLRQRGLFSKVPQMVGITEHDDFGSVLRLGPEILLGGPNRTEFQDMLRRQVAVYSSQIPDKETREEDTYQAVDFYYTPWPRSNNRNSNRHALGQLNTDVNYGYTADWQAKIHAQHAPVYQYVFSYVPENNEAPDWLGCTHSTDLHYQTGWPFLRHNPLVRVQTGIVDTVEYTDDDDAYAYYVIGLWTNFAKYGNPTPEPVTPPGGLEPSLWLPHTNEELNYMHLGREAAETREDYRQHEYAFWREYLPYLVFRHDGVTTE